MGVLCTENVFVGFSVCGFTRTWHSSGERQAAQRAAPLSASLSVPLKWPLTSANPAAQRHYEQMLHALFFQAAQAQGPIRVTILATSGV